jgi:hypothetical protein
MIISRELKLGIQHLRINWFSLRLKYLKSLIKIYILFNGFRSKLRKSIQV